MILVTTYVDPDIDGVASAEGLASLLRSQGTEARAGVFGEPQSEAAWVLENFQIPQPAWGPDLVGGASEIYLVDVSSVNDIERVMPLDRVVALIDHHAVSCNGDLPNVNVVQIELVGSCATLIVEQMRGHNYVPERGTALLLYAAIVSNTVAFRAEVTTDRDREAAAWLKETAQPPTDFVERMFTAKSDLTRDRLHQALEGDLATKTFGTVTLTIFQLEIVGVEALLLSRREEIARILAELSAREGSTHCFLNALDIFEGTTTLFAPDPASAELVSTALDRPMVNGLSCRDGLVLRKQIVPLLKSHLEGGAT